MYRQIDFIADAVCHYILNMREYEEICSISHVSPMPLVQPAYHFLLHAFYCVLYVCGCIVCVCVCVCVDILQSDCGVCYKCDGM